MTAKIKSFMRRSRMPSRPHAMDDRIAGMTTNRTAMMTRKMRNATARIMPTSSWVAVVTLLCIMGCSQSNAQLPSPNFSSVHIGGFPVPTVNGATAAGHCPQFSNSSTTTPQLTDLGRRARVLALVGSPLSRAIYPPAAWGPWLERSTNPSTLARLPPPRAVMVRMSVR